MSSPALAFVALAILLSSVVLTPLLGWLRLGKYAHLPAILGFAAAAGVAAVLLYTIAADGPYTQPTPGVQLRVGADSPYVQLIPTAEPVTWFEAGFLKATVSLGLDPLAAIMLLTVTFIATWIAMFSAGYMHGDDGYVRYFTLMCLFVFCMAVLVLADNFFLLLAGWEGVGVCSYLLVGYYYAKPSAAQAARKAFLVTRLGDVGFVLGILLLWAQCGYETNLSAIFAHLAEQPLDHATTTLACMLLFCGAVGKSAQLPLYVWLPDAMEGPTPVSALIHAATMVTAGVYLLARCAPLFVLAPYVQVYVAATGALTAFLAAFIAVTQTDLKRVLAYSTVSQLGFMFMALGTSGAVTPSVAIAAAIFHLFTHAFFKALLFLGSGSVMHAMGNVIDMRKFAGLRTILPVTHITFLIGCCALAGLPIFAGFWSKDQILDAIDHASHHAKAYQTAYLVIFALALLTALLTAYYTFRAYFLTFWGDPLVPPEAGDHAHESPPIMLVPLVVLAIGAVIVGLAVEPLADHAFSKFLAKTPAIQQANESYKTAMNVRAQSSPHFNWLIAGLGTGAALIGSALAFSLFRKGEVETVPEVTRPLHALSQNKVYVDEIYTGTIVRPAELLATGAKHLDGVIGGLTGIVSYLPRLMGLAVRVFHNGLVQYYALAMVLGTLGCLAILLIRVAR